MAIEPTASGAIRSISTMTFAPDGALIVADWRSGALHALTLPSVEARGAGPYNLKTLDDALAEALGITADRLRVTGMVFDARSGRAWLAAQAGRGPEAPIRIASVTAEGQIDILDPEVLPRHSLSLSNLPGEGFFWEQTTARSFLVTDMKAFGSEILVAGISNADFSSTLRRVAYPFDGRATISSIEMYHAVHGQIETRAPIRCFTLLDLDGAPHVLAAYTCTPLVTIPLADLKDGVKVTGKTIAELGYGNTPLDVIPFALDHQGISSSWVLVANSARTADLIPLSEIVEANRRQGLSTRVEVPLQVQAGLSTIPAPITHVVRLVDQDAQFFLSLRRDPESGHLELVSIRKGAFFRLSDYVNEYDFPGYEYPPNDPVQQGFIRPFHRVMRVDEGFQQLVK